MSFSAEIEAARLTVGLDVRHPFAYLALRPAIELGREMGIEINWVPVVGQVLNPPSTPRPDDDRSILHRRHRANMIAREIAIYAEAQGLVLKEPYRDGPAAAANLAWLWMRAYARDRLEPFLEDVFQRYWALNLDVDSLDEVAPLLAAHDNDAAAFRTWASSEGNAAADALETELTAAGINQAPTYLVEDELFRGRQHLPMIRWILEGRPGGRCLI